MSILYRLALAVTAAVRLCTRHRLATTTKTVIAEAQYVMADGDTLATAEEKVLQRAQRKAVEEAGVYLESTFYDLEQESQGRTIRNTSWEIRTIAAAVTETEVLDSHRSFENDRPVFFIRIRANVDLQIWPMRFAAISLKPNWPDIFVSFNRKTCIFALSFENCATGASGVRMLSIEPNGKPEPVIGPNSNSNSRFKLPDLWKRKFNSLPMPPDWIRILSNP